MELFVVNRYLGEDYSQVEKPDENELKKSLLQKIKKRKVLQGNLSNQNVNQDHNHNCNNSSAFLEEKNHNQHYEDLEDKHVSRKKKFKNSVNEEEVTDTLKSIITCNKDLKTKRKKKVENLIKEASEEKIEEIERQELDSDDEPKRKKSRKCAENNEVEKAKLKKNKKNKNSKEEKVKKSALKQESKSDNESNDDQGKVKEILEENDAQFLVLGKDQHSKKNKVKRVLPFWLANPSIVSVNLKNLNISVDCLPGLDEILLKKLKENNITHFFPVQAQVIPFLLDNLNRSSMYWPNDVCISSPTGSGKTLAFVLPIVQALHKRIVPKVRALVVLPVQDLASQVFEVFETFCAETSLKCILLTNTRVFSEEQKLLVKQDEAGNIINLVDIIITTPGRLVDHLKQTKGICLRNLSYLVIDEADKVIENIQNDWLYHLTKHIYPDCSKSFAVPLLTLNNLSIQRKPPQKLLFSATLSQDPEKLQQLGLFQPKLFTSIVESEHEEGTIPSREGKFIGKFTTPAELQEFYAITEKDTKPLIIHHLLKSRFWSNVLCFVNSLEATSRLATLLKILSRKKVKIQAISSRFSREKRNQILRKFASGEIHILVSSDSLARGMDIPGVRYVISYDLPNQVKTYVHRIGRTGRAGKEGTSLTLLTKAEVKTFNRMIETAGKKSVQQFEIPSEELEENRNLYSAALEKLKLKIAKKDKNKKIQKSKWKERQL